MEKRLYRSEDKMLGGVCAGFAEYFDIDPSIVRILTLVAAVATGFGSFVLAYIVCWVVIPVAGNNPQARVNGDSGAGNGA